MNIETGISPAPSRSYRISGLRCDGCVSKVQATLAPFADSVRVTLSPPGVVMENCRASLRELNQALAETGNYVLDEE